MADYRKSIFLFRRDLRISDNTGLIEASQASKTVVPLFIFDPRQGREISTSVRMRSSSGSNHSRTSPTK
ncbi:MAG: deoxyribodipyrimidine photo-lyase [Halobacteriota archaeon]|jgi:deoxyribodipyrimidine photolyase